MVLILTVVARIIFYNNPTVGKGGYEHLARHERKIEEIDAVPKQRMQQVVTAIISALAGGLISVVIKKNIV